jgi:hypothetical protein
MRIALLVLVVLVAPASSSATDKPQPGRYTPSGNWKGICSDGSEDWGDPMPIELAFRAGADALSVNASLAFQSDDKTQRKATAQLRGKKVGARYVLRGKMVEVADGTEWDIELQVSYDNGRLTGKFIELADPNALMCTFGWSKPGLGK